MSFPISASQLRLLKKQEDERKCEDLIIAVIEMISENVLHHAKLSVDSYSVYNYRPEYELTTYQIASIMKGVRSNFPDCIVKYLVQPKFHSNGNMYTDYVFLVNWTGQRKTKSEETENSA
jgi:hypothetical protein